MLSLANEATRCRGSTSNDGQSPTIDTREIEVSSQQAVWPFEDPPNTAVFCSVRILDEGEWIHRVAHDENDGAWQFHPSESIATLNEVAVTSLRRIVELDPSVAELADLPLGWVAERESKAASWRRRPSDDVV